MNALDNIERTLEEWGQSLRGGGGTNVATHGLQPRDVLHAVLTTLEENRVEGLDHKIYAPNDYTVQLNLDDEERSRLLPFLGADELEAAVQRFCQERKYNFRGPLALQVVDAGIVRVEEDYPSSLDPRGARPTTEGTVLKKVLVMARFNVPQIRETELSRQFALPATPPPAVTDHDVERRTPPTFAESPYRV